MKITQKEKRLRLPFLIALIVAVLLAIGVTLALLYVKPAAAPAPHAAKKDETTKTTSSQSLLLPGAKTPIPLPIDSSLLTRPDGQLILVNKTTPIDLAYTPSDLVLPTVPYRTDKPHEEVTVRKVLVEPLAGLFADAKAANIELMIGSAYRSAKLQETYFNSYAAASGHEEAEKYSAHPGTSEHQLGLAVDLTTIDRHCYLTECFGETPAGKWLAANVHRFGFILRYPNGKSDITGYNYEPWHFRYVGMTTATAIYESGLTYEDAFPYLSGAKSP